MKNEWIKRIAAALVFALMLTCFAGSADTVFAVGDSGEEVKAIEARLIELGYLTGEADGVFDEETEEALLSFQWDNGLLCTGMADGITREVLFSAGAEHRNERTVEDVLTEEGAWEAYSKNVLYAASMPTAMATGLPAMPYPGGPFNTEEYGYIAESGFVSTLTNPLSTFAADIDTSSYAQVRA